MGIIARQTVKNTFTLYLGFAFGALNTLFLYVNFLTDVYYGIISYLIITSGILMPLLTLGMQNTLVKFYSVYRDKLQLHSFTALVFFLPLLIVIPVAVLGLVMQEQIYRFLSGSNPVVTQFVWIIPLVAIAMAYFEIFFAWAKVQKQTVFGHFMKEAFPKVVTTMLLLLVWQKVLSPVQFIWASAFVYILRLLLMAIVSTYIKKPRFRFVLPKNTGNVLRYSFTIILVTLIAGFLIDLDKFMLGQFKVIKEVAYYSVAAYIATVIIVPLRGMHPIIYPITAEGINKKDYTLLRQMYRQSSLALFLAGGFIFLLIVCNVSQLYHIIPPAYAKGIGIVYLLSIAKLSDLLLGNANALIFNSDRYWWILVFGVLLGVLMVVLNYFLIPAYGIMGAARTTLIAFLLYNFAKLLFIKLNFNMWPFGLNTLKTALIVVVLLGAFFFWDFTFHPLINILLKTVLITASFVMLLWVLGLWAQLVSLWHLLKKKPAKTEV